MSNITVIIPVHTAKNNTETYLKKAVESVANQNVTPKELLVVHSTETELKELLTSFDWGKTKDYVRLVENTGDTSFQGQINKGVEETTTEYFTFLECDDELSNIWLQAGEEYMSILTNSF
jgi:glycosyltransferase involved in cell wall biosynthesis